MEHTKRRTPGGFSAIMILLLVAIMLIIVTIVFSSFLKKPVLNWDIKAAPGHERY